MAGIYYYLFGIISLKNGRILWKEKNKDVKKFLCLGT